MLIGAKAPRLHSSKPFYLAVAEGDGGAADGAGAGLAALAAGLMLTNSTSKINVEFGLISGPMARSP